MCLGRGGAMVVSRRRSGRRPNNRPNNQHRPKGNQVMSSYLIYKLTLRKREWQRHSSFVADMSANGPR
jgi:hypothetical protein